MELWDICDSKGIPTGRVMEKGKELGDGEYHVAVEAWIVNTEGEFLIQKRSSRCVHYPNVWSLTAGRIQAGEDAKEGCIREVQEEIGLALDREELIHLAHINREDGSHMIWEVFLARRDIPVSKLTLDPEEVAEVRWVTGEELERMIRTEEIFTYPEILYFLHLIIEKYL